jgi:hypothetical protein
MAKGSAHGTQSIDEPQHPPRGIVDTLTCVGVLQRNTPSTLTRAWVSELCSSVLLRFSTTSHAQMGAQVIGDLDARGGRPVVEFNNQFADQEQREDAERKMDVKHDPSERRDFLVLMISIAIIVLGCGASRHGEYVTPLLRRQSRHKPWGVLDGENSALSREFGNPSSGAVAPVLRVESSAPGEGHRTRRCRAIQ